MALCSFVADWTTRVKQIAKLWRKASSQERAPYVVLKRVIPLNVTPEPYICLRLIRFSIAENNVETYTANKHHCFYSDFLIHYVLI